MSLMTAVFCSVTKNPVAPAGNPMPWVGAIESCSSIIASQQVSELCSIFVSRTRFFQDGPFQALGCCHPTCDLCTRHITGCDPAEAGVLVTVGPEGGWEEPHELNLLSSFGFQVSWNGTCDS